MLPSARLKRGDQVAGHLALDREQNPVRDLIGGVTTAVDDDGERGKLALQPINTLVVERRNLAILLRTQAAEPRFTGMHDERVASCLVNGIGEVLQGVVLVLIIDTNSAFDCDREIAGVLHGFDTIAHQIGSRHKAGTEGTFLDAIAGASDIEIDFIIRAGIYRGLMRVLPLPPWRAVTAAAIFA